MHMMYLDTICREITRLHGRVSLRHDHVFTKTKIVSLNFLHIDIHNINTGSPTAGHTYGSENIVLEERFNLGKVGTNMQLCAARI